MSTGRIELGHPSLVLIATCLAGCLSSPASDESSNSMVVPDLEPSFIREYVGGDPWGMEVSPDGRRLAVVVRRQIQNQWGTEYLRHIVVVDIASGEVLTVVAPNSVPGNPWWYQEIDQVRWSSDSRHVLSTFVSTSSWNVPSARPQVVDTTGLEAARTLPMDAEVRAIAVDRAGLRWALGDVHGNVQLVRAVTGLGG